VNGGAEGEAGIFLSTKVHLFEKPAPRLRPLKAANSIVSQALLTDKKHPAVKLANSRFNSVLA